MPGQITVSAPSQVIQPPVVQSTQPFQSTPVVDIPRFLSDSAQLSQPLNKGIPANILEGQQIGVINGQRVGALPPKNVPEHPHLSPQPGIHLDAYNSSVSDAPAPFGNEVKVDHHRLRRRLGMNMCLNFMTDKEGGLYGFCGQPRAGFLKGVDFHLAKFNPETMKKEAKYSFFKIGLKQLIKNDLPLNLGYFMMDNEGRSIVTDKKNQVKFLKFSEADNKFVVDKHIDLAPHVPKGVQVAQVIPDHDGNYWFMSLGDKNDKGQMKRPAMIGVVDIDGQVQTRTLSGELIENGLAVDESGLYAVSDFATYKFALEQGEIKQIFREPYERATVKKPGTISMFGSGSTPTLMGDDLIALTDNADEQVNLLVYKRQDEVEGERLVCKMPLFEKGKSANENSVIGYNNSIIAQNWYNAPSFMGDMGNMEPGLSRIDVREDRSGCDMVWENKEVATTSTIKLSTQTGLMYAPLQRPGAGKLRRAKFDMAFIDFTSGNVVSKVKIGQGFQSRLMMAPVNFGAKGTLIQPVYSGFVTIKDK